MRCSCTWMARARNTSDTRHSARARGRIRYDFATGHTPLRARAQAAACVRRASRCGAHTLLLFTTSSSSIHCFSLPQYQPAVEQGFPSTWRCREMSDFFTKHFLAFTPPDGAPAPAQGGARHYDFRGLDALDDDMGARGMWARLARPGRAAAHARPGSAPRRL